MTKRIFNRSFAEIDALAKQAVSKAVQDLHARGIATHHMEGGKMVETSPDGARRVLEQQRPKKRTAAA